MLEKKHVGKLSIILCTLSENNIYYIHGQTVCPTRYY